MVVAISFLCYPHCPSTSAIALPLPYQWLGLLRPIPFLALQSPAISPESTTPRGQALATDPSGSYRKRHQGGISSNSHFDLRSDAVTHFRGRLRPRMPKLTHPSPQGGFAASLGRARDPIMRIAGGFPGFLRFPVNGLFTPLPVRPSPRRTPASPGCPYSKSHAG